MKMKLIVKGFSKWLICTLNIESPSYQKDFGRGSDVKKGKLIADNYEGQEKRMNA